MTDTADRARVELRFSQGGEGGIWHVRAARLEEALNTPYALRLELLSEAAGVEPVAMLGTSIELSVTRDELERRVTGIVAALEEGEHEHDHKRVAVTLEVRPAVEALRHRRDTRIFQDMTVPEILEAVLGVGLSPYERSIDNRTSRTYPSCEYRVQYDETDLDFCQRLMEEEGIVYFFEFEGDKETLVLADGANEYASIECAHGSVIERRRGQAPGTEHIDRFERRHAIRPTKLATRHFDWTHPSTPVEGASSDEAPDTEAHGAYLDPAREIYEHDAHPLSFSEYSGTVYGASDVTAQVEVRREAHAADARVVDGTSTVTGMRPGAIFETVGHEAPELDRRYLVVSVSHDFDGAELDEGSVDTSDRYRNAFRCIPDDVAFRPRRATRRPTIDSTLTARVVGPAGEEIHTDEHGRIRVQFHWDREGAFDDHSTCWVRVMQAWAGAGWGFSFIPRIGMEVVVGFIEGDPDRPVVTGAVYDGERVPPYALPDEKTRSTIKTESSLGGGGNNELLFEDLAGSEEIYLHAQKDFNEVVENDHTMTVHHDQTIQIDNDQVQEVGNNQTEHVFANQDLTVDANRTQTVHGDARETIDGSETRVVSSGVTETIDAGETRTISGGMTESIAGGRTQTIDGSSTESIGGSLEQTVTGGITITTPSTYEITAAGGFSITTPAATTIIAPGGYSLLAPGGQTSIDESWFSMGNKWFDNYGMKGTTVVSKIGCNYVLNIALLSTALDFGGARLITGGAFEEVNGAKAETTGAKIKAITGAVLFCGLFNKT